MTSTNCANADSERSKALGHPDPVGLKHRHLLLALATVATLDLAVGLLRSPGPHDGAESPLEQHQPTAGLELRDLSRQLDEAVLWFQFTEDADQAARFAQLSRQFADRLHQAKARSTPTAPPAHLADTERALDRYLADSTELLRRGVRGLRRDTPAQVREMIQQRSQPLAAALERWIQADRVQGDLAQSAHLQSVQTSRRRAWWGAGCGALSGLLAGLLVASVRTSLRTPDPQAQAAALRQERLASLGVLAAGVAHEIRNPLTALKFRLYSLKKALPPPQCEHPDLAILSKEINRLERLVKDFLEFARPAEPQRSDVPAAALVQEVHDLWRPELEKRGLQVRLELDPSAHVWADRQQLQQVLINLVQNAAESTPPGGTLTLGVRQGAAQRSQRAQPMVLLEVSDTGKGIPPDAEPRIFDPFFSTKEGGSGLGLSIAARIVELHEGHLQFVSHPGRTTTFTVVLPKPPPHERPHPPG